MVEPEEFYSIGAEKFAEKNSRENLPEPFLEFIDGFLEHVEQGGRIMDAGCGPGRDVEYFTDQGFDALGIDKAEKMVEKARERNGEYFQMDVRDLDFKEDEFDAVWCNTVLHFFEPEGMKKIIQELKRVANPEGVIMISFKIGEEDYIHRQEYGKEVKQYLLEEEEVYRILEETGLRKIEELQAETQEGFLIKDVICEVEK